MQPLHLVLLLPVWPIPVSSSHTHTHLPPTSAASAPLRRGRSAAAQGDNAKDTGPDAAAGKHRSKPGAKTNDQVTELTASMIEVKQGEQPPSMQDVLTEAARRGLTVLKTTVYRRLLDISAVGVITEALQQHKLDACTPRVMGLESLNIKKPAPPPIQV